MIGDVIEISNKTNFAHIMNYANCETRLQRIGSELIHFKIKINGEWVVLKKGNLITFDDKHNIIIIK